MNYLEHIPVGDELRSLHQKSIFVPCVYFYATKIMIIPYHVAKFKFPSKDDSNASSLRKSIEAAKPYMLKNKSIDISSEFKHYYANCQTNAINFITMIEMHPSKCQDYSFNDLLKSGCPQFIARYLNNSSLDYD